MSGAANIGSTASGSGNFADYSNIYDGIRHNTVERLKSIITALNNACYFSIPKSGKKQDHIDRIRAHLDQIHTQRDAAKWSIARNAILQQDVSRGTSYPSASNLPSSSSAPSLSNGSSSAYPGNAALPSNTWQPSRIAPAAPPPPPKLSIRFKPSPFHSVELQVSEICTAAETHSSTERASCTMHFTLTEEHRTKLMSPRYQLRLYCTSSSHYTPGSHLWANQVCPMEFPSICEIKVNGSVLTANTKGLKKKPGTAPPVDIGKFTKQVGLNRIDLAYMNNINNPFVSKKFYLLVNVVSVSTVDQLVDRLKNGRFKTAQSVKSERYSNAADDDDIVAGSQTMSLKCPLSYMRIQTPCRSQSCPHAQCFDATSWYSMMEQTTTYLCPVCDKTLNVEELIVDGYFNEILKLTPESVEEITVEPDGEWHTTDSKYSSAGWVPPVAPAVAVTKVEREPSIPTRGPSVQNSSYANDSVYSIPDDSDDDEAEESWVRKDLSQSSQDARGSKKRSAEVIDLTFSSDDEDDTTAVNKGKRRMTDEYSHGSAPKRLRTEESTSSVETMNNARRPMWSPSLASPYPGSYVNGSSAPPSRPLSSPTSPPHSRYLPAPVDVFSSRYDNGVRRPSVPSHVPLGSPTLQYPSEPPSHPATYPNNNNRQW